MSGVEYEAAGAWQVAHARGGVVLCSGGYEWNPEILGANFPGVRFQSSTVPTNRGEAWRMAEAAGAALRNRGRCWGWPAYVVPGESLPEGVPLVRTTSSNGPCHTSWW